MNKYSLIIFDMDGTIANTDSTLFHAWKEIFKVLNRPQSVKDEDLIYFSGPPLKESFGKVFPDLPYEMVLKEFRRISWDIYAEYTKEYEGCRETIVKLKQLGFKLAVVTNKARDLALYTLKLVHLDDLIEVLIGSDDVINTKPNPEGIHKVMEIFNIKDSHQCLYVGDNNVDADSAYNAHMDVAIATWGPRVVNPTTPVTYYIDKFLDLLKVVSNE